jgi:hypothetical protein
MLRLLIVLALLPAAAVAGEETVSFQTLGEDGEVVTGKVVELQVEGVLLEAEKATRRVPWAKIHPADRYRLRASVTPEKADARLRLAEQCLDEAYYEGARKELEKALAPRTPRRQEDRRAERGGRAPGVRGLLRPVPRGAGPAGVRRGARGRTAHGDAVPEPTPDRRGAPDDQQDPARAGRGEGAGRAGREGPRPRIRRRPGGARGSTRGSRRRRTPSGAGRRRRSRRSTTTRAAT